MRYPILLIISFLLVVSCNRDRENTSSSTPETPVRTVNVPAFNADSAYLYVEKQVAFGPRVPGTSAHHQAGDYLVKKLEGYGAQVVEQTFEATTFDGKTVPLRNIIASFNPNVKKRVLLASHWDTRPFADKDKQNPDGPMDGANDGASGVAVLLEIGRVLHNADSQPEIGVDLILFDGEDWGEKDNSRRVPTPKDLESWWCLGSQYWSKHKHRSNYAAYYGILLDMVGGKNAQFCREAFSLSYAPKIVEKVWDTAEKLEYSHIFVKKNQSEIMDDHLFVNQDAKIPMIDIVNFDPATGSFGSFHHTQADNMDLISKKTLKAVGETLLNVLYYEQNNGS